MATSSVFISLILSQLMLLSSAGNGKCPPSFDCGYLGTIGFPFTNTEHPECGMLAIHGCEDQHSALKRIQINGTAERWFNVTRVQHHIIFIRDDNLHRLLLSKSCEAFKNNYTLPPASPLGSFNIKYNTTLFRCNHTLHANLPKYFSNYTNCTDYKIYYSTSASGNKSSSSLSECSTVVLPVGNVSDINNPFTFLSAEVAIHAKLSDDCKYCRDRKSGHCQLDSRGIFYCAKEKSEKIVLIVAVGASAAGLGMLMILARYFRKTILPTTSLMFWRKENSTHQIIETYLKEHGPLPTIRYNYSEVKKITNSFKNKLGQGGYGSVYKGKLQDGRLVAVKVLSESKGNGEEFINEVASISRTSHVNVVVLLGFCFQRSKRALIYEYMSNGSLEKFIYEENALISNRQLDCKTLYDIAIGVARGLEYLHRGCNTRILHFDIKPHNILLDENFCPKISDFGLAKIYQRTESIVSPLGARGTAGYIAPEVFSRNFGGVSHKSDVYSFGMMVLEIVGRRQNINVQVENSSEVYFPHWIYKHLELNQEFELRSIKNESDKEMAKKMLVVSLWCIQIDPVDRPAMSKVVDMLEGSLDSLQLPPRPFSCSP